MFLKRFLDLFISIIIIILLLPLLSIFTLLIYLKLGSPIFFTQNRVGKNGKIFKIIKFRTMLNLRDNQGFLLKDKDRLTPLGQFLRNFSIDELPELINVIKGDMSLVGPRPLLVEYIPLYSKKQFKRHDVLPGITGLAQINGRNRISWQKKFEYDVWYVENWSLILDMKIIIKTILKVLKKEGVNQNENMTMEKFNTTN